MTLLLLFLLVANLALPSSAATRHPTSSPVAPPPTQVYVPFPVQYMGRINNKTHPRIFLPQKLAIYKQRYSDPNNAAAQAFKGAISSLMGCSVAACDWRHDNGWPAAALALTWHITGQAAYGQKACDVFVPDFQGIWLNLGGDIMTSLHWALAYDWLYGHPCMGNIVPNTTLTVENFLLTRLISWSNNSAYIDDNDQSDIAHDSDRNDNTVSGHFFAGVALLGDSPFAPTALSRGWTGFKYGLDTAVNQLPPPYDVLTPFPLVNFYRMATGGMPLTGWDYGPGSDLAEGVFIYELMSDLGIIDDEFPDIKVYWKNSLAMFMRSVDPAATLFKWVGDIQDPTDIATFTGYLNSYLTNCIYFAEIFGFKQEAAWGRYWYDNVFNAAQPSWKPEGYPDVWMMHSWNSSFAEADYSASMSLNAFASIGSDQAGGFAWFRTAWSGSSNPSAASQVTWGSVCALGNYIVDHIINCAGSIHLWRNGDFLLTDPRGYQTNTLGEIFNSLSILNPFYDPRVETSPAVDTTGYEYLAKGPLVYESMPGRPFLQAGRQDDTVFYAMVNMDNGYNLVPTPYDTCNGVCMTPVGNYTRHFTYDMGDVAIIIDRLAMQYQTDVALRFRNNGLNSSTLPVSVSPSLLRMPSDRGNYRTLIKILTTPPPTPWVITDEHTLYTASYQIQADHIGAKARTLLPRAWTYNIVSALHMGPKSADNTALNSAGLITSSASFGGCALSLCVIVANTNGQLRKTLQYSTPAGVLAGAKHVVADMTPGCYIVSGGGVSLFKQMVVDQDFSLVFTATLGGAQTFSVSSDNACTFAPSRSPVSSSPTTHVPTKRPTSSHPVTSAPTHQPSTSKPTSQAPSHLPSSAAPSHRPTSVAPTHRPTTLRPSSGAPTLRPTSAAPTHRPTSSAPTHRPSSSSPTKQPTTRAPSTTALPTSNPTASPISSSPSARPTLHPTHDPSARPTLHPTHDPSARPTLHPTHDPTRNPTVKPTGNPSKNPTLHPSAHPTGHPTLNPTENPTGQPTENPTGQPTKNPMHAPTNDPTANPTRNPIAASSSP